MGPPLDLDAWIEKVKRCEYLLEDELKQLSEYVRRSVLCFCPCRSNYSDAWTRQAIRAQPAPLACTSGTNILPLDSGSLLSPSMVYYVEDQLPTFLKLLLALLAWSID